MVKISRNAKCPCGSGKKYKRCCLGTDADPARRPPAPFLGGDHHDVADPFHARVLRVDRVVEHLNRVLDVAGTWLASDGLLLNSACVALELSPTSVEAAGGSEEGHSPPASLFTVVTVFPSVAEDYEAERSFIDGVLDELPGPPERRLFSALLAGIPTLFELRWGRDDSVSIRPSGPSTHAKPTAVELIYTGPRRDSRARPSHLFGQAFRFGGDDYLLVLNEPGRRQLAAMKAEAERTWEDDSDYWLVEPEQFLLELVWLSCRLLIDPDGIHGLEEDEGDLWEGHPQGGAELAGQLASSVLGLAVEETLYLMYSSEVGLQRVHTPQSLIEWDGALRDLARGGALEAASQAEQAAEVVAAKMNQILPLGRGPSSVPEGLGAKLLGILGVEPDGTIAGCEDPELQRAPWEILLADPAHRAWSVVRAGATIREALDWAERQGASGEEVITAWRSYRAEERWTKLTERGLQIDAPSWVYDRARCALFDLFHPRLRETRLCDLGLKRGALNRLHGALVQLRVARSTDDPLSMTLQDLHADADALVGCAGFGKGTLVDIGLVVSESMKDWRWRAAGIARDRQAQVERPPEALATLADGLDELAGLFD